MTGVEGSTPAATQVGVYSEVGKLRRVMIHRPDLELKRLTPDEPRRAPVRRRACGSAGRAQQHDAFADLLRDRDVEVLYLEDLLAETLAVPEARPWVLDRAVTPFTVGAGMDDEVRAYLEEVDPTILADHLIGGLTAREAVALLDGQGRRGPSARARIAKGSLVVSAMLPDDFVPAPAAQQLLHARPIGLDLRRRRRQPDVLAGPPARGPQRRGRLPLPPAVPRRRLRVLVLAGAGRRVVRPRQLRGRRHHAHRQPHGRRSG